MINEETKYIKEFDWKQFMRIAGSVFFTGLGVAIGVNSNGELFKLIICFAVAGIGVALLTMD